MTKILALYVRFMTLYIGVLIMHELTDWVQICAVSGMATAKIITGRLESEDIPARLLYEAAGPIYAITVDGLERSASSFLLGRRNGPGRFFRKPMKTGTSPGKKSCPNLPGKGTVK